VSKRVFRAAIVFTLGTAAVLTSGCFSDSESGSASKPELGSIGLSLQLAPGTTLNSVSYTIAGPNACSRTDTEGVSYVGGGKFVLVEERYRQVNLFTYAAGTTLFGASPPAGFVIGTYSGSGVGLSTSTMRSTSSTRRASASPA
jgi:hypothetical protein